MAIKIKLYDFIRTRLVYCIEMVAIAVSMVPSSQSQIFQATIFAPVCPSMGAYGVRVNRSIELGTAVANDVLRAHSTRLEVTVQDACDDVEVMEALVVMKNMADKPEAILGPFVQSLCEPATRMARSWKTVMIQWACVQDFSGNEEQYGTPARTMATAVTTGLALASTMTHFRWKRCVIYYSSDLQTQLVAQDIQEQLTMQGLLVVNSVNIYSSTFQLRRAARLLDQIPSSVKGRSIHLKILFFTSGLVETNKFQTPSLS